MSHKNEQLRIQDILFYTSLKTIDIGNALEVWKERKLTIPITIFIELIYMSSYIKYQSEITIIFPAKNGKNSYVRQRRTQTNFNLCVRAQAELKATAFERFSSG